MEFDIFMAILVFGFSGLLFHLYHELVGKPAKLRSIMSEQGITGPPGSFLLGNIREIRNSTKEKVETSTYCPISHNIGGVLFPFFEKWRKLYGELFVFSLGNTQILYVNNDDVVKEMTTCTSLDFGKPQYQHKERGPLLGQGILTSNGAIWYHQRKILAPQLYMDKVKKMIDMITESANSVVNSWMSEGGIVDIKIDEYMRTFSGDVISRACFGSNYAKGEEIFLKLRALQELMSRKCLATGIPGARYLPTKTNREAWALEKEIRNLILQEVKDRKCAAHETDLLQMVLEGAENSDLSEEARDRFVVDNCKNIYLAGYETTAVAASWCLMLLASNPYWQDRVRAEVVQLCQGRNPDADMLHKMKRVTMVIQETLRLYPPVPVVSREALKDIRFGNINIPKGVSVWSLVTTLHTNTESWGEDAFEFNPNRFANGISSACKFPHLYMPFGVGPRVCLGQNLAMIELKILISLIISNFSFTLSPTYRHSPALKLVIEPENGVNILLQKL